MGLSSARPLSLAPAFYARLYTQRTPLLLFAPLFTLLSTMLRAFSSAVRRTAAPAASLGAAGGLLPFGAEGAWGAPLSLFNNNMGGLRAHVEEHAAHVNAICFVPGYAAKDLHVTVDPATDILMVTGKHGRGARQESATAFFELPHMELGKAEVHLDKGVLVRPRSPTPRPPCPAHLPRSRPPTPTRATEHPRTALRRLHLAPAHAQDRGGRSSPRSGGGCSSSSSPRAARRGGGRARRAQRQGRDARRAALRALRCRRSPP